METTALQNQAAEAKIDDREAAVGYFEDVIRRAEAGDEMALPAIREWLSKVPGAADRLGGNLAANARRTLIAQIGGKNLLLKESVTRKLEVLREELAGSTPLERLLVDRIVTCWLGLHHLESLYAAKDSMPIQLATYFHRSIDRAQRRYLSAIKALAMIRKLAVPTLQVNIAKEQVNLAGS